MKLGSEDAPTPFLLGSLSWRTMLGLLAFGRAGLFYAAVLRAPPLSVAQSFAAAQFVAVILASTLKVKAAIPTAAYRQQPIQSHRDRRFLVHGRAMLAK